MQDGAAGTFILLAGLAGGAAGGWLLTNKYEVDAGAAHSTTIGLLVGAANGALLIEPTGATAPTDGRPAALYRRGPALRLHPAILRG